MKRIIRTASRTVVFIAAAASANAADVAAPDTYDWSGFYAGLNSGVAMDSSGSSYWLDQEDHITKEVTKIPWLSGHMDSDQTAFTAGGILGYYHQIGRAVLGVEADFNYLGLSYDNSDTKSISFEAPNLEGLTATSINDISYDISWFGTLRGHLGYAFDNMMIYSTGGLAYGKVSVDHSVEGCVSIASGLPTCATVDGSQSELQWGWTLGGGLEYGLDRWSLGLEYLYVDLGSLEWETDRRHYEKYDAIPMAEADLSFSVIRTTARLRF